MISEKVYKENYRVSDPLSDVVYTERPVRECKTGNLVREYFELNDMWEMGVGDDEAIEKRMVEIDKELSLRGGLIND